MTAPATRTVRLSKVGTTSMVGMTLALYAGETDNPEGRPRIHHMHPDGLAAQSG